MQRAARFEGLFEAISHQDGAGVWDRLEELFEDWGFEEGLNALAICVSHPWFLKDEHFPAVVPMAETMGQDQSSAGIAQRMLVCSEVMRNASHVDSELVLVMLISLLPRDTLENRFATAGAVLHIHRESPMGKDENSLRLVLDYLVDSGVLRPYHELEWNKLVNCPLHQMWSFVQHLA